jgi:hypothetical protein
MVADYVVTEHDCRWARTAPDPVGLASYTMDSHNCARVVVNGVARNEGDVQVAPAGPYGVSYRAIVPARGQCANLVVPVAFSASHIAFGSARMEPVFMVLGHAAGSAAHLAVTGARAVQDVDYPTLRRGLLADGMVLSWPPGQEAVTVVAPAAPSGPFTATATVTNVEGVAVSGVSLALAVPAGWPALAPQTTPSLAPGATFTAHWQVTPAPPVELLDPAELRATATYTAGGPVTRSATTTTRIAEPVTAPFVTAAATTAYFSQRGTRLAVVAAGRDMWTGIDEYGAILRPGVPATVAEVTLVSQTATDPNARAGLAFRNNLRAPGTSTGYVALVAKPGAGFLLLWDANADGTLESVARWETSPTPYPARLRLTRAGTRFTGAVSVDGGVTWRQVGTADVPSAAATQDVGVVTCAHATILGRAVFTNLVITA